MSEDQRQAGHSAAGKLAEGTAPAEDVSLPRPLSPAAERALAEAAERRRLAAEAARRADAVPKEFGGREGPDPARYGDWETKGIASDF
jgi:hypothetical protein